MSASSNPVSVSDLSITLLDIEAFLASDPTPEQANEKFPFHVKAQLKGQLNPALNDPSIIELNEIYASHPDHKANPEISKAILERTKMLQETPDHQHFRSVFGALDRLIARSATARVAPSSRAARARLASEVFTQHAGRSNVAGARDIHGNARDASLAHAGAYAGMRITVLIYNWENRNDFRRVQTIAENLGFEVVIYDGAVSPTFLPSRTTYNHLKFLSDDTLDDVLTRSSQCWIISGTGSDIYHGRLTMTGSQRDIIIKHWKEGMGLYVLGDNDPFFVDANFLLKSMYPGLDIVMSDNYRGNKNLSLNPDGKGGHIVEDYLTTGIVNCYSGDTVAEIFNTKLIPGFVPVMYESTNHLTVGYAPATETCGPVVISGAFTTFYHGLDTAGSTRFIENTIAFLSTRLETSSTSESSSSEPVEVAHNFKLNNAMIGECSISFEDAPLAILLYPMSGDPLRNCSDTALNNNLARPKFNAKMLGRNPISVDNAVLFLRQGNDPFTRRPIAAFLPVADIAQNYQQMTLILCNVFMSGLYLPFQAWMNFISACQHMIDIKADHADVWQFFLHQSLSEIKSTADFSDMGPRYPLRQVIGDYLHRLVNDNTCVGHYSLGIKHCEMMFKLHNNPNFDVTLARHRVFLRALFSFFRQAILNDKNLLKTLERSCYDFHLDLVPIFNTGHLSDYYPTDFPAPPSTCTPNMLTYFYHQLCSNWSTIVNSSISTGFSKLVLADGGYLWNYHRVPTIDAVTVLNQRFTKVFYQRHNEGHVPFATTYGPTSLSCTGCGMSFVPEGMNLITATVSELGDIRLIRDAHFKAIYQDDTGREANAPYHRTVRYILRERYPGVTEFSHAMLRDCVDHINGSWGNFYVPELLERLTFQINSYLALRRDGAVETNDASFITKVLTEIGRI